MKKLILFLALCSLARADYNPVAPLSVLGNPTGATISPAQSLNAASLWTLLGSIPPANLPVASTTVLGGVKVDGITININGSGVISASGGASVQWGNITGTLSNQTDLVTALSGKQPLATNLTSLSGLSYAALSFVKMTSSGTFALDTTSYATALPAPDVQSGTSYNIPSSDYSVAFTGSSAASYTVYSSPASNAILLVKNAGTAVLTLNSANNFFTYTGGFSQLVLMPGDAAYLAYGNSTWLVQ